MNLWLVCSTTLKYMKGRDVEYEKIWFIDTHMQERIVLDTLYWSENYCAWSLKSTWCKDSCTPFPGVVGQKCLMCHHQCLMFLCLNLQVTKGRTWGSGSENVRVERLLIGNPPVFPWYTTAQRRVSLTISLYACSCVCIVQSAALNSCAQHAPCRSSFPVSQERSPAQIHLIKNSEPMVITPKSDVGPR